MIKYLIPILFSVFLSSCASNLKDQPIDDSKFRWVYTGPVSKHIEIKVVSNIVEYCIHKEYLACAIRTPELCTIYLPKPIHQIDPYYVYHEVKHCMGWVH